MGQGMTRADLYAREEDCDEVSEYLIVRHGHAIVQGEFDVWQWWIGQAQMYPVLSRVAQEILLIPATSASSERSFSKAANLKTHEKMSLKATNLEDMMALAGNMKMAEGVITSIGGANE
jgi:hypothetical protein